eukprot:1242459-Rhodomonas_salina.1
MAWRRRREIPARGRRGCYACGRRGAGGASQALSTAHRTALSQHPRMHRIPRIASRCRLHHAPCPYWSSHRRTAALITLRNPTKNTGIVVQTVLKRP